MLKGEMFIVPNAATAGAPDICSDRYLNPDEVQVQVWCHGSGSENWADHKVEVNGELEFFPGLLPFSLLAGVKEGDTITFEWHGTQVELTARQQGYRYQRFGMFEDVLRDVVEVGYAYRNHSSCDNTPEQVDRAWEQVSELICV